MRVKTTYLVSIRKLLVELTSLRKMKSLRESVWRSYWKIRYPHPHKHRKGTFVSDAPLTRQHLDVGDLTAYMKLVRACDLQKAFPLDSLTQAYTPLFSSQPGAKLNVPDPA